MQARQPLLTYAVLMLLCVFLTLCIVRPSTGQAPAPATARYQLMIRPNDTNDAIYVLDMQSGQCWFRQHSTITEWTSLGSPVGKKQR